jgi:hypothetical protein
LKEYAFNQRRVKKRKTGEDFLFFLRNNRGGFPKGTKTNFFTGYYIRRSMVQPNL